MGSQRLSRFPTTGLWLVFFVNGAVLSSWAPRIPEVKARLSLSDAMLGLALFGVAAGSVPALLFTGWALRFLSARLLCIVSGLVFAGTLPGLSLATGPVSLAAILAILGAASGCLDVAMNTAGVHYQRSAGRTALLSRLHGGFSLGVLAGAGGGALATRLSVGVAAHFGAVAVILVFLMVAAATQLPREPHAKDEGSRSESPTVSPVSAFSLLPISIMVLAVSGLLVEGMITDWSALLIGRDFGGGENLGATAVVAFSVAMFVSRTTGDWLAQRFGRHTVLTVGAAVIAVASIAAAVQSSPIVALAAVTVIGLAAGPVFPLTLLLAADLTKGSVAAATAAVSAIGYFAFLGGPPLIGVAAQNVGLTVTVAVVGTACASGIALSTRGARSRELARNV